MLIAASCNFGFTDLCYHRVHYWREQHREPAVMNTLSLVAERQSQRRHHNGQHTEGEIARPWMFSMNLPGFKAVGHPLRMWAVHSTCVAKCSPDIGRCHVRHLKDRVIRPLFTKSSSIRNTYTSRELLVGPSLCLLFPSWCSYYIHEEP